ncbi:hypothetical protein GW17_00000105 [Ensete ventricosum]|nr:hypothetical protein GW17_00000105 [Ensete ventricosum]
MATISDLHLNRVPCPGIPCANSVTECSGARKKREVRFRALGDSEFLVQNGARTSRGLCWNARGSRRAKRMVVAASPPTDDAVVVAEPLTKEDLVGYLASGCKPKEMWRYVPELLLLKSLVFPA